VAYDETVPVIHLPVGHRALPVKLILSDFEGRRGLMSQNAWDSRRLSLDGLSWQG